MKSFLSKFATIALFAFVLAPAAFAGDDEAPRTLFSVADCVSAATAGPYSAGRPSAASPPS